MELTKFMVHRFIVKPKIFNVLFRRISSLDVDRLWDVVGKQRGVPEVLGLFLVLTPLSPTCYNFSIAVWKG